MIRLEIRPLGGGDPLQIDVRVSGPAGAPAAAEENTIHVAGYEIRATPLPEAIVAAAGPVSSIHALRDALISLGGLIFLIVAGLFAERISSPDPGEAVQVAAMLLGLILGLFGAGAAVSIANRALNGRFLYWRSLRLVVETMLTLSVLGSDLFGLRWWIGGPLMYEQIYRLLVIAWAGWVLWRFIGFLFPLIRSHLRIGAAVGLTLVAAFFSLKSLVPLKDTSRFLTRDVAPIPPPFIERAEVSPEEYLQRLERLLGDRDGN